MFKVTDKRSVLSENPAYKNLAYQAVFTLVYTRKMFLTICPGKVAFHVMWHLA